MTSYREYDVESHGRTIKVEIIGNEGWDEVEEEKKYKCYDQINRTKRDGSMLRSHDILANMGTLIGLPYERDKKWHHLSLVDRKKVTGDENKVAKIASDAKRIVHFLSLPECLVFHVTYLYSKVVNEPMDLGLRGSETLSASLLYFACKGMKVYLDVNALLICARRDFSIIRKCIHRLSPIVMRYCPKMPIVDEDLVVKTSYYTLKEMIGIINVNVVKWIYDLVFSAGKFIGMRQVSRTLFLVFFVSKIVGYESPLGFITRKFSTSMGSVTNTVKRVISTIGFADQEKLPLSKIDFNVIFEELITRERKRREKLGGKAVLRVEGNEDAR